MRAPNDVPLLWPSGRGQMAALIRNHDWAATPLGPISQWPPGLRTIVDLILSSPLPMYIFWGPELTQIYNDAFIPILAHRHPTALGQSTAECWWDVWHITGPLYARVLGGEAICLENPPWTVLQNGRLTDTYFRSWTALIRDETGAVRGAHSIVLDTTDQARAEAERSAAEQALRVSEGRLQATLNVAGLSTYSWDAPTNEFAWGEGPGLREMWGLSPDAEVNEGYELFLRAIHPDDQPRMADAMAACADPEGDGLVDLEFRVIGIEDLVERWIVAKGIMEFDAGKPLRFIGAVGEISEQKRSQQINGLLVAELQHRTRNLLGLVRSIARHTAQTSTSMEVYHREFDSRLGAISRSQGLIARQGNQATKLVELVHAELSAHGANADGVRVHVAGPDVPLLPKAVQALALAIHELATNALKYGALAQDQARLAIMWTVNEGLHLSWRETGVRLPCDRSFKRGFGLALIEDALPYDLGARSSFEFTEDGIVCEIELPPDSARARGASGAPG